MAAAQRGRKAYFRTRRIRRRRSRKILSRRRKLHSRRGKKMRTKRIMRLARSHYRRRRLPTSQYSSRRMKDNVLSSQKAKHIVSSYRSRAYHRKPLRVGRPRKKKEYARTRSGTLQAKLRKRAGKKRAKHTGASVEKKAKRKTRSSEEEILYSLANSSGPKATSEERQAKKHSVHFSNPGNAKAKEMGPQEDLSTDNQSNQQTVTPKKRSRHSATPIFKTH